MKYSRTPVLEENMFCLNYYRFEDYVLEAQELKIKYRKTDTTLKDFLLKYSNKSIVIKIQDDFDQLDAKIFKEFLKECKNFKLILDFQNKGLLDLILSYELPFFFSNFVNSIDKMWGLLEYSPTDMYICEELGFNLKDVSNILHSKNIKVRVFPNICQSSFAATANLKAFFIRPDDIEFYSDYVDVFELISDPQRQKIIYKIYKEGKWFGALEELIPTLKMHIDNRFMLKDVFANARVNCRKKCLYNPNSCHICDQVIRTSQILKENNIYVKPVSKIAD